MPTRAPFAVWRETARRAVGHAVPPALIDWSGDGGLFAGAELPKEAGSHVPRVPAAFLDLAQTVIWHSAPERFARLYEALWRLDRCVGDPLSPADPLGQTLRLMEKSVRRDIHKMHAFLRFRELPRQARRRRFAAWFEPQHNILEPAVPFFQSRFSDTDWMIATPGLSAHCEGGELTYREGSAPPDLPPDASEALWGIYFENIFNPARIKLGAMRSEMPRKYWKNLPETRLIPDMLAKAEGRVRQMHSAGASAPRPGAERVSERYRSGMPSAEELPRTLADAGVAAAQCRLCGLCEKATQTVWGEGAGDAALMIVGEQPGDVEDLAGRPFVGPAGQLLRAELTKAAIDPARLWLTNAVKHFKFEPRGKRRLHQNPNRTEIEACRWWLQRELALVRPKLVLALGASAAFALTGKVGALSGRRGVIEIGFHGGPIMISWHPSYILRLPDPQHRAEILAQMARDLSRAAEQSFGETA
ncbi:UdgX family uracil-DNA binding protein [Paracoccus sp. MBLB3053]|uniref:Type-4 uracil-DNA glycosylase n=1 Tax=Paracoccus aurantius TaxID=3073814 RepID=A0ABU2HYE6_9RHOB|nr:UdgX family uracil-DNA binding protein [Paracoccus sp. MBLB3053]MDS9469757.1 UdgX family uracil-DNA binding protein [Paracoccus sp. MBLB3053]